MSAKENKDLVTRYTKESNAAKGDAARSAISEKYLDPRFVFHFPLGDLNFEQTKQFSNAFARMFPDFESTIDDMVAEGDKVVTRGTWRGIQKGEWLGVAPTGKKVTLKYMSMFRIVGGKLTESWLVENDLDAMVQLGVVPNPYFPR